MVAVEKIVFKKFLEDFSFILITKAKPVVHEIGYLLLSNDFLSLIWGQNVCQMSNYRLL